MKQFFISFLLLAIFVSCNDDENFLTEENPLEVVGETQQTWQYIESDEMVSRDGTTTGFLASLNNQSANILIYLEGGGACFNAETCGSNRDSFDSTDGENYASLLNATPSPIIDRNLATNPYKDWNYIFVPYSTGDIHSGSNDDADVPFGGPQDQQMKGADNMEEVVELLGDYFEDTQLDEIILTGSSAGGYGVYLNVPTVMEEFPAVTFTGIVDAGPIFFDETIFAECLSDRWENLFDFDYPDDFDTVVTGNYTERLSGIYEYLSAKYPDANFGLISDTQDSVLRYFYGFGDSGCTGTGTPVTATDFETAIYDVQANLAGLSNWSVYFVADDEHTFLGGTRVMNTTVNGVSLLDWLTDVRSGTAVDITP